MSKCQHKGCDVSMSSGDFCHRHLPVRCPLCNQILSGLLDAEQKHGPNRCVISMDAYRAVETQRDQARKELEDWKRLHSQPIHNPPEAIGEYVAVMGEMTTSFTVQLPVELCREPVACDDPAIEAALQAVSGYICTYIWGEDKKPAVVYCDVGDQNVEIESDDRTCLKKDSTRLTDEAVNSGSCNDGELHTKRDRS